MQQMKNTFCVLTNLSRASSYCLTRHRFICYRQFCVKNCQEMFHTDGTKNFNEGLPKNSTRTDVRKFLPSTSAPAEVYLQVLQSGCQGYGKSLFLFTSSNRYLFNCPENSGRFINNAINRVGQLDNIFVTQCIWSNTGGLPGFGILKRSAAGGNKSRKRPAITFHGPQGMDLVFRATKCVYDGEPPVQLIEKLYTMEKYEDDCLLMDYIPLFGREKSMPDTTDNEQAFDEVENSSVEIKRDVSVAYLCRLKQKPGRLMVEKCFKAGVPSGPLLGELANGRDIKLADGRTIRSVDVMEQPESAPSFAVVDVSDEFFLESLLNSKGFDHLFDENDKNESVNLDLLVHLTTDNIFASQPYQNWMKKFGTRTKHLVLNTLALPLPHNEGSYRLQAQLNYINSDLFPLIDCHKHTKPSANLNEQIVFAEPLLKYHLRPHEGFKRDDKTALEVKSYVDSMSDNVEFVALRKKYYEDLKISREIVPIAKYPEVLFCGTGSATPAKYRNITGILLNLTDHHSILLDCGEGTYTQLFEIYGADEIDRILCNIKLIFISHLHPDHHMGLFTILIKRKEAFERLNLNFESVYIIGAPDLFKIQAMYSKYVENVLPFARRIYTWNKRDDKGESQKKLYEARSRLNLRSITVIPVFHPKWARGIVIRLKNGQKIVYSGDTRPCPDLVEVGLNADLLIHEATFEDDLRQEAVLKNHSTISEAVEISEKMHAKRTILTHFSARYPRLPLMDDSNMKDNVGIAFDYLKVNFSNFEMLPKLTPVFRAAFAEYDSHTLKQAEKRSVKRSREEFEAWRQNKDKEKQIKQDLK